METIRREIRLLKAYAVLTTGVLVVLLFTGLTSRRGRESFEEIDVERINIVEADGTLRMVISNQARQHPGIVNGKVIQRSTPRPPGMIFFNQHGDEMGGLIFGANGDTGHFGSFTWDKVRNDQTIGFRHLEGDDGRYSSALEMWQRPNIPSDQAMEAYEAARALGDQAARDSAIAALEASGALGARRLFFGKGRDDALLLDMRDVRGRTRIRMSVAPGGEARLEFLDEDGGVVYRIPES